MAGAAVVALHALVMGAAHAHGPVPPSETWLHQVFGWDPLGAALLVLLAYLYLRGSSRLRARSPAAPLRGARLFWSGSAALAFALSPPLESLTGASFAVHMIQHEILMLLAAPLLVLSRPQGVLIWGLPQSLARLAGRVTGPGMVRRAAAFAAAPLGAWVLHALVLWGWHVPPAFQATLVSEPLHWLQHASFFLVAVLFWYSVLTHGSRSVRVGAAFLSIFTTALHTSVLGALLTFSRVQWYPAYRDGGLAALTALEDQQLGGLIMWVPGGLVFLAAAIAVVARAILPGDTRPGAPHPAPDARSEPAGALDCRP